MFLFNLQASKDRGTDDTHVFLGNARIMPVDEVAKVREVVLPPPFAFGHVWTRVIKWDGVPIPLGESLPLRRVHSHFLVVAPLGAA